MFAITLNFSSGLHQVLYVPFLFMCQSNKTPNSTSYFQMYRRLHYWNKCRQQVVRLRWIQRAQEVFQWHYIHSEPLFSVLAFILSLLPVPSVPLGLTATVVGDSLVFLSSSVFLVSLLCTVTCFQAPLQWITVLLYNEKHKLKPVAWSTSLFSILPFAHQHLCPISHLENRITFTIYVQNSLYGYMHTVLKFWQKC